MRVPELGLAEFTRCEHQTEIGCAIYATRQQVCRTYYCAWARGMVVPGVPKAMLRPDRLGMVVAHDGERTVCVEAFEGGFRRPLARLVLDLLAREQAVRLLSKGRQQYMGPPGQVRELVRA